MRTQAATLAGAVSAALLALATACGTSSGGSGSTPTGAPSSATTPAAVATVTATVTTTTRAPTATATAPASPAPSAPAVATPAADPAATVRGYYAAINAHDYPTAWALGGRNLDPDYAHFAAGFADTASDTVTVDGVHGGAADIHLHAVHTDGSTADYAGSYTVSGGVIVRASVRQVGGSSPSAPAVAPGTGSFNPAVTQDTIQSTICVSGWTATVRPPASYTEPLKKAQLAASGRADQDPSHYQEDHIVPLELGGAPRDPANLRPVPQAAADRDDGLENSLHADVCAGRTTLADAQQQILQAKAGEG
ncbi:hypothetical protein [Kitasatospora cinereorecta]|uniref:HNH endonuclease n=1 Tax=Kitasatospora cinereorecta TaxID=285560 RepID=A0ABW0VFH6_9ACTN